MPAVCTRFFCAIKTLEHERLLVSGDAGSCIRDFQYDPVVLCEGGYADLAVGLVVMDGVVDKVACDLKQKLAFSAAHRRFKRRPPFNLLLQRQRTLLL